MLRRIARALAVVALLLLGFVASSVEITNGNEPAVTTHAGGVPLAAEANPSDSFAQIRGY